MSLLATWHLAAFYWVTRRILLSWCERKYVGQTLLRAQSLGTVHLTTGMRRITSFRSTTDRIYDGSPIGLYKFINLFLMLLICHGNRPSTARLVNNIGTTCFTFTKFDGPMIYCSSVNSVFTIHSL